MKPERVQLSRRKGWRMPPNTVKVARPGKWGNPFIVTDKVPSGTAFAGSAWGYIAVPTLADALACYREMLTVGNSDHAALIDDIGELRGKNLACWCELDQPCHADVLLELANET
jgi:hypothetical protein